MSKILIEKAENVIEKQLDILLKEGQIGVSVSSAIEKIKTCIEVIDTLEKHDLRISGYELSVSPIQEYIPNQEFTLELKKISSVLESIQELVDIKKAGIIKDLNSCYKESKTIPLSFQEVLKACRQCLQE